MRLTIKLAMTLVGALAFASAHAATPSDLLSAGYAVYTADLNGDGCADYLIKAKDRLVMLNLDDLLVPIPVPSANKPFVLQSTAGCTYTLVQSLATAQIKDSRWAAASNYSVVAGNVRGDAAGSLLILPASGTNPLFNVVRNADLTTYTLLQVFKASDFQIGVAGSSVEISDVNADNRSDLSISQGDAVLGVYSAAASGMFILDNVDNRIEAAKKVWAKYIGELKTGTVEGALSYVTEARRPTMRAAMTSPEANLVLVANSIVRFAPIRDEAGFITAAVVVSQGGEEIMYFVSFGQDFDGVWRINSM